MLALTALPRAGKDTAALLLVEEHGFYQDSFGAEIYKEISAAFGVSIEDLKSDYWKKNPVQELCLKNCTDTDFVRTALLHDTEEYASYTLAVHAPHSSRFILQRWATEYRRAQDELYWVKKTEERIYDAMAATCYNGNVVISDLREMHEYMRLQLIAESFQIPFRVIEIIREGTVKTDHSSDAGIPEKLIHSRIQNVEGQPEILLAAISRTVKNIQRIV